MADPDRDAIFVVSLDDDRVIATIALDPGDQPGRMAMDDSGIVHVALRGGGAIASIDIERGALLSRQSICPTPTGLSFHQGRLHVACQSGALHSWNPREDDLHRVIELENDLRDVVGFGSSLYPSSWSWRSPVSTAWRRRTCASPSRSPIALAMH